MNHIAVDLGGRKSQICVRSQDGAIVEELSWETAKLRAFFASRSPSRVVMETCSESFTIADWALGEGHDTRIVPATLAPALGVGARGIKTDVRDARALSEASCRVDLHGVHLRSQASRQRQALIGMRDVLVTTRTALINSVKGWLRTHVMRLETPHTASTFAARMRATYGDALPSFVKRQLEAIEDVSEQVKAADAEIDSIANADALCVRLRGVPGVGPVTAVCFTAVIDAVGRFPNAKAVYSYLGLSPGERSSSSTIRRTGLTKAGSPRLRRLLVQCAWQLWRLKPQSALANWANQIAARRGKGIAVVAVARKLAGILFAMWRDGSTYAPSLAAQS